MKTINPHCQSPFIAKLKSRWYIVFKFTDTIGNIRKCQVAYQLNSDDYIKKVNGADVEVNKKARLTYANNLINDTKKLLSTKYFNPTTKEFESLDKADLPFINYLREYIDYTPNRRRTESTKNIYLTYNNVITEWLDSKELKAIPLKEVTKELIAEFLDSKESEGATGTRDNYLVYLKSAFKYCVDYREVLQKNPLKLLNAINNNDSETNRAYPSDLRDEVLAECKVVDVHLWLLLRLIFYTLRRPSELLKLQYKDFDFETGSIHFKSQIVKTNKTLYSYLPIHLLNDIKELIGKDKPKPNDYFMGNIGRIGKQNKYDKRTFAPIKTPYTHFQDTFFGTIKSRLNLEDGYTPYGFKHSGVVYCIEVMNWSDYDIIAYSGHTNINILGRYSRDAKRPVKAHTAKI